MIIRQILLRKSQSAKSDKLQKTKNPDKTEIAYNLPEITICCFIALSK